jgi:hypothetical protein
LAVVVLCIFKGLGVSTIYLMVQVIVRLEDIPVVRGLGASTITLMVQVIVRLEDISVVIPLYPHQLPRARELDISLQGSDAIHSLVFLDIPQSPLDIRRLVLLLEQRNRVVDVWQCNLPQFRTDLLHLISPSLVDWELRAGELPYELAPAEIRREAFAMPRCTEELDLRSESPRQQSRLGRRSRGGRKEGDKRGSRILFFCDSDGGE